MPSKVNPPKQAAKKAVLKKAVGNTKSTKSTKTLSSRGSVAPAPNPSSRAVKAPAPKKNAAPSVKPSSTTRSAASTAASAKSAPRATSQASSAVRGSAPSISKGKTTPKSTANSTSVSPKSPPKSPPKPSPRTSKTVPASSVIPKPESAKSTPKAIRKVPKTPTAAVTTAELTVLSSKKPANSTKSTKGTNPSVQLPVVEDVAVSGSIARTTSVSTRKKASTKGVPAAPVAVPVTPVKVAPKVAVKAPEPFRPKPVKPVKAPAINLDDPFLGIDELSDGQFIWQQIEALKAERAVYQSQSEMLRAEADQLAIDMEPGDVQFDDESGEGTPLVMERERDLQMSANAAATVDEIDRSIASIDTGFYGYCETCQKPIVRARLRAMPAATQCVACKSGGLSRR